MTYGHFATGYGNSFGNKEDTTAEWFLRKTLNASHTQFPRVINVDQNAAYPPAVDDFKAEEQLPETTELRQVKYLNNLIEQDHRFIKRLTKPSVGFGSFNTAQLTIRGMEAMHMRTHWTGGSC